MAKKFKLMASAALAAEAAKESAPAPETVIEVEVPAVHADEGTPANEAAELAQPIPTELVEAAAVEKPKRDKKAVVLSFPFVKESAGWIEIGGQTAQSWLKKSALSGWEIADGTVKVTMPRPMAVRRGFVAKAA
jgi:hypothetical protein